MAQALSNLVRGTRSELDADLFQVEVDIPLPGTAAIAHCYTVSVDGMGWPRVGLLLQNICDRVIDYAIPRDMALEAHAHRLKTGSSSKWMQLGREAKALFTTIANSGEGGELLLFCLAEAVLGFPQLLCKMYLKTATAMHYHGSDGVHASVDPTSGGLTLWWGESKLHKSASGAISDCLKSLAPFLMEPQNSQAKRMRDLQLLRYGVRLEDSDLEEAIKLFLDTKSTLFNKVQYGGIGLVGFNHTCYPEHPKKSTNEEIASSVLSAIDSWRQHSKDRISEENLENFHLHLFYVPFPSVDDLREQLFAALGIAS